MSLKEFLRPTKWKLVLFIVLFILSLFVVLQNQIRDGGCDTQGFPLPVYEFNCISILGSVPTEAPFNFVGLVFNLIIWYLVSCLTVFIYTRLRK